MKPILFSTPMVQAILNGRKTMTRRVIKQDGWQQWIAAEADNAPYRAGDILWVRETWNYSPNWYYCYKADAIPDDNHGYIGSIPWKPSIHMPREAARIFLRVTDVRAERLQEITEEDAVAEGIDWLDEACYENNGWHPTYYDPDSGGQPVFRDGFIKLWDSLNAKRGYGWDVNPWCWVIEFERCEKPE